MKAVICIIHPSRPQPPKYGDFIFMPEWKALVWKKRVFDLRTELEEFHAAADKLILESDHYPKPTIRLGGIAEVNLATVPIEELVEGYRLRSREAKIFQLKQAREAKKQLAFA